MEILISSYSDPNSVGNTAKNDAILGHNAKLHANNQHSYRTKIGLISFTIAGDRTYYDEAIVSEASSEEAEKVWGRKYKYAGKISVGKSRWIDTKLFKEIIGLKYNQFITRKTISNEQWAEIVSNLNE